jgi:hypothetical protein
LRQTEGREASDFNGERQQSLSPKISGLLIIVHAQRFSLPQNIKQDQFGFALRFQSLFRRFTESGTPHA